MQKVVVNFDKDELQKTVDFHLNVVSTGNIKSQEAYRRSLYREFIKSSLNQLTSSTVEGDCESSCPLSSIVVSDLENKNIGLEIQEDFDFELGIKTERENTELENQSDFGVGVPFVLNEEILDLENQNALGGVFVDDLKEEMYGLENEKVIDSPAEYCSSGVFIDDRKSLGAEYCENGVFVEDISVCDAYSDVEYCENGVFVEDIELEEYAEEVSQNYPDISEEDNLYENDLEDVLEEGISDIEYEEDCEDVIEQESGLEYEDETYDKEDTESTDDDCIEVAEEPAVEYESYGEESIETQDANNVEAAEEPTVYENTSHVDEGTPGKEEVAVEVPSDIRAFLKKNPNSDVDFVLKYYSKKDVEKALKLGRIYKKRGKLVV